MALKINKETNHINQKEVMHEFLTKTTPRYESHKDLFERAKVIKRFLREYLLANPLNKEKQEKYGFISHSRIMSILSARAIGDDDEMLDYQNFKNCEVSHFTNF